MAERAEARQASLFERAFGLLGAAAQGEFKTRHFAIVTINYCSQMTPAAGSARHMGQVHGPAFITPLRAAPATLDARPRRRHALMYEPTFSA